MTWAPTVPRGAILIDSSAFLSLISVRDAHHQRVRASLQSLTQQGRPVFTTNYVVAECHALLLARIGRPPAEQFLRETLRGDIAVIQASDLDEHRAREIIFGYHDKDFSLTDALSFAIMERLGIREAFSLDRHFVQFGLSTFP